MSTDLFERSRQIRELLVNARLGEALQMLYDLMEEVAPDRTKTIIPSMAAQTRLENERTQGTVTADEYRARNARLEQAVDALLRDLERNDPDFVDIVPRTTSFEESFFVASHLRSVGWLRGGLEVARSVVRIRTSRIKGDKVLIGNGTGFLITGGRILTNRHVLSSEADVSAAVVYVDHEDDGHGSESHGSTHRLDVGSWRVGDAVDCAVARLIPIEGAAPVADRKPLVLCSTPPVVGDQVAIVQHPRGKPKQLAATANHVVEVGGGIVKYTTHTLPGSSGAPVFNERWEVVALHARGGNQVGLRMFANAGILIKEVIHALKLQTQSG